MLLDRDALQWPAMIATVLAAWYVSSTLRSRRLAGFRIFLVSNVLWIAWAWWAAAWAVVVLQVALAALNIRGVCKQAPESTDERPTLAGASAERT